MFVGPSGVGKTTLARIISLNLDIHDVQEIDAASNSGVDAARQLAESSRFRSLIDNRRMIILDECHTLSKQAWQPLLKILEEPPTHLYFALCTTEQHKVPDTIKTRCQEYILHEATAHTLEDFIEEIPELVPLSPTVKGALISFARGSIRRLLSGAEKVYRLNDDTYAKAVLQRLDTDEESPAIAIARMIASNRLSWERLREKLLILQTENPESVRIVILSYLNKVALSAPTKDKALYLAQSMDALRFPMHDVTGTSDLFATLVALLGD